MTPAEMIILTFVGIPLGLFLVYLVAKIAAYGVLKGKQIFDREAKQDNFDREAKQDKDNKWWNERSPKRDNDNQST